MKIAGKRRGEEGKVFCGLNDGEKDEKAALWLWKKKRKQRLQPLKKTKKRPAMLQAAERINIDIYFLKILTKIQGAWYNQSLVCRKDENTLLLILELV